jgi:hypothetical protein
MSPIKDPKYFMASINEFPHRGPGDIKIDKAIIRTWNDYLNLFSGASVEKRIGEASCGYLYYYEHVAPLIKRNGPEAKIIAILRKPVERAYSAYSHLVRDGRETLSFEEAIEIEEERKKRNYEFIWFYKDLGFIIVGLKLILIHLVRKTQKYAYMMTLNNPPAEL